MARRTLTLLFFYKFPNVFAICIHTLNTISKLCVEKRGRVEECSVAPLRDKRVENLVWLAVGKRKYKLGKIQTKTYN
jgi:hypothetical protein